MFLFLVLSGCAFLVAPSRDDAQGKPKPPRTLIMITVLMSSHCPSRLQSQMSGSTGTGGGAMGGLMGMVSLARTTILMTRCASG